MTAIQHLRRASDPGERLALWVSAACRNAAGGTLDSIDHLR